MPSFLPLLQSQGRGLPLPLSLPWTQHGGGEKVVSPSHLTLQPIFYTFNFLTCFTTLFLSTNLPSWSQHVPFWCPTWPPKWGPNRGFLEFKSQLMLQQRKMSKFVLLLSDNLVLHSPAPQKPSRLQQKINLKSFLCCSLFFNAQKNSLLDSS